jgi:hypothetical protein
MGDTFSNISNSTIVNRSLVQGAVTCLRQSNKPESAEALRRLVDLVEQSGNSNAGEYLNGFTEEMQKSVPRKTIVRSMWEGIQKALPGVSTMLQIVEGIEKII